MELLTLSWLGTPVWMWLIFVSLVITLLALDLGVLNRGAREIGVGRSLMLSAFYMVLGVAFGGWVWWQLGREASIAYLTGFIVEKSLAMDNVFVIAMIFGALAIPREYQHRVLFWGILGVIVLRAVMIGFGAVLVSQFSWVLYLFAAFLIVTGIQMWRTADQHFDVENSRALALIRRHLPVTATLAGERFFVRRDGKWWITPLFVALLMVEFVDIVFAVDSVPAIFAITTDPFLVYTSNIFAILGLRALYFALAAVIARFAYLKYALALLLVFIGGKIFVADAFGLAKVPPAVSLGVTFAILACGIGWSLWNTRDRSLPGPSTA
jgi:tellurite resistance protein TerC